MADQLPQNEAIEEGDENKWNYGDGDSINGIQNEAELFEVGEAAADLTGARICNTAGNWFVQAQDDGYEADKANQLEGEGSRADHASVERPADSDVPTKRKSSSVTTCAKNAGPFLFVSHLTVNLILDCPSNNVLHDVLVVDTRSFFCTKLPPAC